MALQTQHRLLVPLFVAGLLVGVVAGLLEVPGEIMFWLFLGAAALGCLGWRLYRRRLRDRGEFDERDRRIEHRSANVTLEVVYGALIVFLGVVVFTDYQLPTALALLGLVFGGAVLQVGLEKYYSRRM